MTLTLRQRTGLRHSSRNGRVALGRPAVYLSAIQPYADLRSDAPAKTGFMARIEASLGGQWNTVVRTIREKLKM